MCVGPEDFAKVSAAQDAARTEWRDYEMSCGNYKTAMSYSVTDEEIAECEQARDVPGGREAETRRSQKGSRRSRPPKTCQRAPEMSVRGATHARHPTP